MGHANQQNNYHINDNNMCVCVDNSYMYLHDCMYCFKNIPYMSLYVDYLAKKNNEGIYLKSFFLFKTTVKISLNINMRYIISM